MGQSLTWSPSLSGISDRQEAGTCGLITKGGILIPIDNNSAVNYYQAWALSFLLYVFVYKFICVLRRFS